MLHADGWCVNKKRVERLMDGTKIRFLTVVDEYTRECLSLRVGYSLKSDDVMAEMTKLFSERGIPGYIHSGNGSEFSAHQVKKWIKSLGVQPLYIEPGIPWKTAITKDSTAGSGMNF